MREVSAIRMDIVIAPACAGMKQAVTVRCIREGLTAEPVPDITDPATIDQVTIIKKK